MSKDTPKADPNDPLLASLRELPPLAIDASLDKRLQREARAVYVRSFEDTPWYGTAFRKVGRAAVPVFLAGIVGLYMTWAIATATALVH
jgi:hypothetical protein